MQALRSGAGAAKDGSVKAPVKTTVKTDAILLKLLGEQSGLSLAEAAKIMSKSTRAIERVARKLREDGRLRRVGPKNGGHWEVLA